MKSHTFLIVTPSEKSNIVYVSNGEKKYAPLLRATRIQPDFFFSIKCAYMVITILSHTFTFNIVLKINLFPLININFEIIFTMFNTLMPNLKQIFSKLDFLMSICNACNLLQNNWLTIILWIPEKNFKKTKKKIKKQRQLVKMLIMAEISS